MEVMEVQRVLVDLVALVDLELNNLYNVNGFYFLSSAVDSQPVDGIVDILLAQTGKGIAKCEFLKWEKKLRNINLYVKFKVAKQIEITSCYKGTIAKVLPGYIIKDVFLVTGKNYTPSTVEKSSVASPRKKEAGVSTLKVKTSAKLANYVMLKVQNISQADELLDIHSF
ncbi:hypothetical protein Tco_1277009 [Tanacetum coccineum]